MAHRLGILWPARSLVLASSAMLLACSAADGPRAIEEPGAGSGPKKTAAASDDSRSSDATPSTPPSGPVAPLLPLPSQWLFDGYCGTATFVCAARPTKVWAFDGTCDGGKCDRAAAPACLAERPATMDCETAGSACITSTKRFVCLPASGNAWAIAAQCGDGMDQSCTDEPAPSCDVSSPGARACAIPGARCMVSVSPASTKVFTCVER